jgi:hypothetical protein
VRDFSQVPYATVFPSARGKMLTLGPGESLVFVEVREHRLPAAAILHGWFEPLDANPEPQPARLPGGAA